MNIVRLLKRYDWPLLAGLIILAAASLVSLASSGMDFFYRQMVWYILAFTIIFLGAVIPWPWLWRERWFLLGFYWFSLALLLYTHLNPYLLRGTKSWIVLGNFQFEPAELMKVSLILLLASFFSRRHLEAWSWKNIFFSFASVFPPVLLVAAHPDFGSAMVLAGVWIGFLFFCGTRAKKVLAGLALAVAVFGALWFFAFAPYQKARLVGFLFPSRDPLGVNYNVIQSKIAVGSAGFLGKGFREGTQTRFNFLPEAETDFLFAAFVEEWGFLGGAIILLTFFFILYRITVIGVTVNRNDDKFAVLGIGIALLIQVTVNVGGALGLLPVSGITFPFLGYGGSSLLTTAILFSILERIKLESSV